MQSLSSTAMVLAAGVGQRMRPLSLQTPKPLLTVGGKPMIDYALDKLKDQGVARVIVNTHYLASQITAHLASRKDLEIVVSHEEERLDTGGAVKKVIHYFDDRPFFVLSADLPWVDAAKPGLARLAEDWDGDKMDALLLMMPTAKARGFSGKGDFSLDSDGRASLRPADQPKPYVFISAQILKPSSFAHVAEKIFSNRLIWAEAEAKARLFGSVHDGTCYHCGTPEDLADANARLTTRQGWA